MPRLLDPRLVGVAGLLASRLVRVAKLWRLTRLSRHLRGGLPRTRRGPTSAIGVLLSGPAAISVGADACTRGPLVSASRTACSSTAFVLHGTYVPWPDCVLAETVPGNHSTSRPVSIYWHRSEVGGESSGGRVFATGEREPDLRTSTFSVMDIHCPAVPGDHLADNCQPEA